tara:strand:+ start:54565 stop:54840 length:276 start_codon:yes stop_codon:yes gene_type:complete
MDPGRRTSLQVQLFPALSGLEIEYASQRPGAAYTHRATVSETMLISQALYGAYQRGVQLAFAEHGIEPGRGILVQRVPSVLSESKVQRMGI